MICQASWGFDYYSWSVYDYDRSDEQVFKSSGNGNYGGSSLNDW